jgi:hypothetical protein
MPALLRARLRPWKNVSSLSSFLGAPNAIIGGSNETFIAELYTALPVVLTFLAQLKCSANRLIRPSDNRFSVSVFSLVQCGIPEAERQDFCTSALAPVASDLLAVYPIADLPIV